MSRSRLTDPLALIRRVLDDRDSLFLSRQVAYRMSMAEGLPKIWADAEEVMAVLSSLITHLAVRAPRRSSISMGVREFSLRSGRGVEFSFKSADRFLREGEHKSFMAGLFDGSCDLHSGVSLAGLREHVMHQHGRLWADHVQRNTLTYHIVFPTSKEVAHLQMAGQRAFRYDISIVNYPAIRKRFGIKKSRHLVEQIEGYVKSLVRYPIDMVTADPDKGTVTTIYETQHGAAESVSSRISKRLGAEVFHVGRRPVELAFRYHLTALSKPATSRAKAKKGSS